MYLKIKHEIPDMNLTVLLRLEAKAITNTMGIDGLVPSLLVFRIIPGFPIIATEFPMQNEQIKELAEAKAEYEATVAKQRILTELQYVVPTAADRDYELGDEVLVFREEPKECIGLMAVTSIATKWHQSETITATLGISRRLKSNNSTSRTQSAMQTRTSQKICTRH